MKFEKIQPEQVLYDVHSYRMGNTTLRSVGVWPVRILSVDASKRTAIVSWNGNPPALMFEHDLRKLRESEPEVEYGAMGICRLKPRAKKVRP
jgi:hypothetical protein